MSLREDIADAITLLIEAHKQEESLECISWRGIATEEENVAVQNEIELARNRVTSLLLQIPEELDGT